MTPDQLAARLRERFPQAVIGTHGYRGQATVALRAESLLEVAGALRDDPQLAFDVLMDLTAVDHLHFGQSPASRPTLRTPSPLPYYMPPAPSKEVWERLPPPEGSCRFDVVYHFYSSVQNHRLRLKVPLPGEDPAVPSLTSLWAAADWFEREVWDMFGIRFIGHPNLKRILLYEGFVGHPLRKDYPVNKRQPLIGPVN